MTQQWSSTPYTPPSTRSVDATFAALRTEAERCLTEGLCVALVVEAPDVKHPELLLTPGVRTIAEWSPSVFWHADDETLVGLGVYAEATGPWGDTSVVQRFADEHLPHLRTLGPTLDGNAVFNARVITAIGFAPAAPKPATAEVWRGLNGSFACIPRLVYVRRTAGQHPGAWFCLTLRPADLSHLDVWTRELASLGRKLRAATLAPGQPAATLSPPRETDPATWGQWIEAALGAIDARRFDKVVAARYAQFSFASPLSPAHTLLALAANYGSSTRFGFFRGDSVFLGATPERLIKKRGLVIETEALAGTVRGSAGAGSTRDFGPKEHKEHSPVLAQLLDVLAPHCSELSHDPSPQLRAQQQVLHLQSTVRGKLNRDEQVLGLVAALHPTPAVGGRPTPDALTWIGQHEDFDRGLYAGPIGWLDAVGNGNFSVALRSGILRDNRATLFAGAGIVAGSEPSREFDETALKMQVLLGSVCHAPEGAAAP